MKSESCYCKFDRRGDKWIDSMIFRNEPIFTGIDGSTGIDINDNFIKHFINSLLRKMNRCFSKKYILFR